MNITYQFLFNYPNNLQIPYFYLLAIYKTLEIL